MALHPVFQTAFDAAKAAGVRQLLMLSAMGANADDSIPLRRAELHLERSGLAWNVIRPNWFMQNFHTFWLHGIQTHGQIFLPVGDAKGSFIDTRDVAAVAAKLLSSDSMLNRLFIEHYYEYKRQQGYSELEISQKRDALENVLIPYRMDENVDLLKGAGFTHVEDFFRWYNFSGIIAVKRP